ncbi:sensor histidine kinase [Pontibacter rugosus]
MGKHFSVFYTEEANDRKYPAYELNKALSDGRFEDEGWRLRKDGTPIWVNVVITPVYNAEERLIGFTKVTRDLSERKKNEELMLKNRELHRINTDLDNFIYTASHDLKAPIANLEGLVAVLKHDLGPDISKHEEVVNRIENSITRLNNIILDLTDVSRIQQEDILVEPVHIEELLEEVKGSLEDLIASYGAVIDADFSGFTHIHYSKKNFRSILFNLVSNAIKYSSPERNPIIRINTEKLQDEDQYLLTVADNGLGIEKKHTYKIFSMFKRMHSHVEGTGLGLYLVKRILENSEDRIEVESKVGQGTTFKLYFHQGDAS